MMNNALYEFLIGFNLPSGLNDSFTVLHKLKSNYIIYLPKIKEEKAKKKSKAKINFVSISEKTYQIIEDHLRIDQMEKKNHDCLSAWHYTAELIDTECSESEQRQLLHVYFNRAGEIQGSWLGSFKLRVDPTVRSVYQSLMRYLLKEHKGNSLNLEREYAKLHTQLEQIRQKIDAQKENLIAINTKDLLSKDELRNSFSNDMRILKNLYPSYQETCHEIKIVLNKLVHTHYDHSIHKKYKKILSFFETESLENILNDVKLPKLEKNHQKNNGMHTEELVEEETSDSFFPSLPLIVPHSVSFSEQIDKINAAKKKFTQEEHCTDQIKNFKEFYTCCKDAYQESLMIDDSVDQSDECDEIELLYEGAKKTGAKRLEACVLDGQWEDDHLNWLFSEFARTDEMKIRLLGLTLHSFNTVQLKKILSLCPSGFSIYSFLLDSRNDIKSSLQNAMDPMQSDYAERLKNYLSCLEHLIYHSTVNRIRRLYAKTIYSIIESCNESFLAEGHFKLKEKTDLEISNIEKIIKEETSKKTKQEGRKYLIDLINKSNDKKSPVQEIASKNLDDAEKYYKTFKTFTDDFIGIMCKIFQETQYVESRIRSKNNLFQDTNFSKKIPLEKNKIRPI